MAPGETPRRAAVHFRPPAAACRLLPPAAACRRLQRAMHILLRCSALLCALCLCAPLLLNKNRPSDRADGSSLFPPCSPSASFTQCTLHHHHPLSLTRAPTLLTPLAEAYHSILAPSTPLAICRHPLEPSAPLVSLKPPALAAAAAAAAAAKATMGFFDKLQSSTPPARSRPPAAQLTPLPRIRAVQT